ncbi:MAG: hypothetical protein ABI369_13975, partial [Acetobacteraceae bacterium]
MSHSDFGASSELVPSEPRRVFQRGGRRAPSVAERKQQLRDTAIALFAAEGVDAVSVTRLNTEAGLPAGSAANLYASCE